MIKENLVDYVTSYLNEDNEVELNMEIETLNPVELFHYHTVKRLLKEYRLFLLNDKF